MIAKELDEKLSAVHARLPGTTIRPNWSATPSFADGLAVQAVCDAMERSAGEKRWVTVAEITSAHGDPRDDGPRPAG